MESKDGSFEEGRETKDDSSIVLVSEANGRVSSFV